MIYHFGPYPRCATRGAAVQATLSCSSLRSLTCWSTCSSIATVMTKDELLEHCWAGTFVSEAALTRCLAKVRKAIEPELARSPVIQTRYGRGYHFVAPVTVVPYAPVLPSSSLHPTPHRAHRGAPPF